jgi:predicted double-glycine peptidase
VAVAAVAAAIKGTLQPVSLRRSARDLPSPVMRIFGPLFLLIACLLTGGCASVGQFKGLTLDSDSTYVSGVTPIRQDKNYACGAACVAAVAAHWGVSLADFKARHPSLPADSTGHELQKLAEGLGLQAVVYRGSMEDLQQNLSDGRPLIVMIPMPLIAKGGLTTDVLFNVWNEVGPRPSHWVVVVGSVKNKRMIIADPASGPLTVRQDEFQKWWAQKNNLCVLIAGPPGND